MHREWLNRLLVLAILIVLIAAGVVLVGVYREYQALSRNAMESLAYSLVSSNALKDPDDVQLSIGAVENLVRAVETTSPLFRRIYVTKMVTSDESEREVVLYPFWYSGSLPDWPDRLKALERRAVSRDGRVVGALYCDLDTGALVGVQIAIGLTAFLILLTLGALAIRLFAQERALTATTEILEQNQRELIRLERLSLAGLLTANVMHDIRKPMTNIKHEISDLSEALGSFAGATRALRNINDQVQLFFDILRDLNMERFIRSEEGDEEYVDANRVLEQSLKLVQYERGGVQLKLQLRSDLPLVLVHPYRLVQVFSNLILNAYQAMDGRGELRVTSRAVRANVSPENLPEPLEEPDPDADHLAVEIIDNGPGISDDALPHLFSPFYTTKPSDKGTGLGLYISKTIVEQMKGHIHVSSTVEKGTRFVVILPGAE